ncbi:disulfide oxidoreductase [Halalkalibacterium halodurans]|uniref:disulfide formation protein C n=1 Tax=Halalkalibacterium halodurans TaxID=86665 RepID=UPI002AA9EFCF|nr:disulfide oxidoreductase [Halalkalibacterium halodurans]MDY7222502.1 disulfide oxidoreductase [Halalkalibacterium halodurans]MDY7241723.1 disulfide oxidoreductase [Halalkalibacterium halodurans]MED3645374.1 disulfide oxidoreductase [Halalkalibacterium halodurans]MED4125099.1 disulfide oxidoreductase [Halalkalibacterium halodurans]
MSKKVENLMLGSWLTALTAMLGSLYFSEIRMYEPCTLCWYQRIIMYPLVLILFIGYLKRDVNVALYSLWFSLIGMFTSLYHYSIQKLPFLTDAAPACGRVPCTGQYINWFGFVTIPFLAFTAFVVIFICSLLIIREK